MIFLITGPMKCGKSTEMYRLMERSHLANKRNLLIKPKLDSRDFFARNVSYSQLTNVTNIQTIANFKDLDFSILDKYDNIFVDEFFMIKNNEMLCQSSFKGNIYFGGLLADRFNTLWPEAISILPYCESITKLTSICDECGSEYANYSFLDLANSDSLVIGDSEYKVLCKECYFNAIQSNQTKT